MEEILGKYKTDLENELFQILDFWQKNTIDKSNGGFYGKINNDNKIFNEAPKGSVLNSRILWTFSAAFNLTKKEEYLQTAEIAFNFLRDYFIDKEFGGVFWTVDYKGNPLDTKKQIYALAFAIYGLCEYYIAGKNEEVKELAINLFNQIVGHSYDNENGGYIEALSRNWKDLADLRLSKKDANEKKSMNTHLHLLEAFSNLYRVWPNEKLKERITELIFIFLNHIIDLQTNHVTLFFDEKWNKKSNIISYGHDIETAWLLEEAAVTINKDWLIEKVKKQSILIVNASTDGMDIDGGLWYEYDLDNDNHIKEKHWWPQAEAMVGFFNAWQITNDESFLRKSVSSWRFIKKYLLDKKNGEWFWGIKEGYTLMDEDKAGIWKCPYHNGRACIELIKSFQKLGF